MPQPAADTKRTFADVRAWVQQKAIWLDQREGLTLQELLQVFGLVALVLILRCPSLFYRAQFYAEDGVVWYRQAYTSGWLHSLVLPEAGYLNSIQRLGAGLSLLVPFRWAPLVMVLVGLVVQTVPVCALLSARCRNWGSLSTRAVFAILYVVIPDSREIHIVLTNSQWHFAVLIVLLGFASVPRTWRGRVFDVLLFLLAGFCGPFCMLLIPMVIAFAWLRRQPWSLAVAGAMVPGALAQAYFLHHSTYRNIGVLGASLAPLIRIVGGDIISCMLFGGLPFARYAPMAFLVPPAIGGLIVYLYTLRYAQVELKLFILFSWLLLAASLRSPLQLGPRPLWLGLLEDYGSRYWFFPALAFVWSLVWCTLYARHHWIKVAGKWTLIVMLIGITHNLRYHATDDFHFPEAAARFREAEAGTRIVIPIMPKDWQIDIVKRQPAGRD